MATDNLLQYYREAKISPVLYQFENWQNHFERRDSVYRHLGVTPSALKNTRVLEVAAGSGQNAVYLSSCFPSTFEIVEPNETALIDLKTTFKSLDFPHVKPDIHEVSLEEYQPEELFDFVFCENWLGSDPHELALRKKLADLVAPGGMLISTCVSITGFFPNIVRRMLANRLKVPNGEYSAKVQFMTKVFSNHLSTMPGMTRSHEDWVKDCILNPHYLKVGLPIKTAIEYSGSDLEICGTMPQFSSDWRWFKELHGQNRRFNEHAIENFNQCAHNFISYKHNFPTRKAEENVQLIKSCEQIWKLALEAEKLEYGFECPDKYLLDVACELNLLIEETAKFSEEISSVLERILSLWQNTQIDAQDLANDSVIGSFFGRELIYTSHTKKRQF